MSEYLESNIHINTLQSNEKEKLWSKIFWYNYNPDFSYKKLISRLEQRINEDNKLYFNIDYEWDHRDFLEVISLIKKNNYKLDLNFLERLTNKQKILISHLFLWPLYYDFRRKNDERIKAIQNKSLFFLMHIYLHWSIYGLDWDKLYKILESMEWVNAFYLTQTCRFLDKQDTKYRENYANIINEYHCIKTLDENINSTLEKKEIDLRKDFSLIALHARWECWYWRAENRWYKQFDKEWKETDLEVKDILRNWYTYLDRSDKNIYNDFSWTEYNEFLDAPCGVALTYKDKPVACISFYIKNWNELFINQIQKVSFKEYDRYWRCIARKYNPIINNIDWETTLYNVTHKLAKNLHCTRIIIQWWENNRRTKELRKDNNWEKITSKNGEYHLKVDTAKKIYDDFAESKWLWKNKKTGNRELKLE